MSKKKNDDIAEFPQGGADEEVAKELTPEEIEAKQEEAKVEAEKSRIVHLEALRMNPFILRDTFQKQILDALVSNSNKVKALCESYCKWAEVMMGGAANAIDTEEVAEQMVPIISRYQHTIINNSLVVSALFQKTIQEAVIKVDPPKAKALCEALEFWNDGECVSGGFA